MNRTTMAVLLAVAFVAGIIVGAALRPARADDGDEGRRGAVALESIARTAQQMDRHLERISERCTK